MRRAERWSSRTGSGRRAATQPVARGRGSSPPDQARTASKRACPAAITSPMRMPTAAPEGPKPASDQHEHGDEAHAHFDEEVHGQRPVGPMGLEQAAVQREQHEEGRRGQDGGDPDAAGLVEQHGHGVAARGRRRPPRPGRAPCPAGAPGRPSAAPGGPCRPRASSSPGAPRPPRRLTPAWRG